MHQLHIKMRYSIDWKIDYMQMDMDFCLLLKTWVKWIWSYKYDQKILDSAKNSATDAIKTASKRAINKTARATGDLIGNKIADRITSASRKSNKRLSNNGPKVEDVEITTHKKDTYLQKKNKKLLMN